MTNIFIFNNASRAAGYGIGTYIKQLAEGLSAMPETKVSLVEMYADTKEFAISDDKDGIRHYLIPPLHSGTENETYCRVIFYFLARNIDNVGNDKIVFQFNYFQHYPLAVLLKAWYINSCIVLTVHYMSWLLSMACCQELVCVVHNSADHYLGNGHNCSHAVLYNTFYV